MENIGGGLGFKATLDIDDFNVSAATMERQIRNFSTTANKEVEQVEQGFQRMAEKAQQYLSYYLVGQGMHQLISSIIETRGQFQQLEIAFGTMLGSEDKANTLMQQMVDTAAKTPFDLMGVAEGAKQLLAYGVSADKVNDTLVRLGNIASGLSIPLNDIVYLYGTTMVQGRLYAQDVRQFTGRGIPLVAELAEKYHTTAEGINEMVSAGKIGFPDVEEVLNKMTNEGGQFYQLMEKQSSSLTGQIANLQDAWDTVLNDFGEAGQGLFSTAIEGATAVVEHMDDIVRILKSVAIGYGSVKAAIALNSAITKGHTGIVKLDNLANSAKLALMKSEAALSGELYNQKKKMETVDDATYKALTQFITAQERDEALKKVRIASISNLLTAEQKQYLSQLSLTETSKGYETAAMGILTADQKLALSKVKLEVGSDAYKAAMLREAQTKLGLKAATLDEMRASVKAAAAKSDEARKTAILASQDAQAARYQMVLARSSGNAIAIQNAEKRYAEALDNAKLQRDAMLAARTEFLTKKKQLETAAITQSKLASQGDTVAKTAQSTATNILTVATGKLMTGLKALWATMAANPLGAILSLVGLVYSAFTMFSDSTDDATESLNKFGETGEKQLIDMEVLYSVLQNGTRGTNAWKKAFDELNEKLKENNLKTLDNNASIEEITASYKDLTAAMQANNAETARANSLDDSKEEYAKGLDELRKTVLEELKGAHHYNWSEILGIGWSSDSKDIQQIATSLAPQISRVIEGELPKMVKLDDAKKAEAKEQLRKQITDILKGAQIDESHAEFITNYDWLTDTFKDVFSGDGGLIDQALELRKAYEANMEAGNKAADEAKKNAEETGYKLRQVTQTIDISTLSLEELHDVASKLDGKTVSIDCKTYGFDTALAMLQAVNAEINKKQNNLNTRAGLRAEIQKLKEDLDGLDMDSKKFAETQKTIDKLENKLNPKKSSSSGSRKSSANDAQRNAESLRQKQLDADKRLEEARIAVMEEGYEKRKAQLDLQHKEALRQIKKEEDELKEARKKAGKGGLTSDEKANFQERRNLENTSYTQSQNKLFEGELDYKKKQYQLYFRWVQNMGKEVADKQFEKLLADGNSYKQYVENEISKLEEKRKNGTLTEGEGNYLISLNTQKGELNGETTALEKFKQQVSDSIGQCQTLAEKIEAVAKAKEKLENGESGIVSTDERAEASLSLSQQDAELQKELQNTVLNDYRTFEEQKLSITKQYELLRSQAEKMGDTERLAQINKAEQEALSALNMSFLQQSESWKNLFSDIDTLTVAQIEQLIADIQTQLNAGNLKLNPVDYKAVIDSLNQAKQRIQELNPFQALGTFHKDYIAARKRLKAAEAALAKGEGSKEDVENAKKDVKSAAQGITNSIQKVTSISTDCASSLQSMFDALGMDGVADGLGTAIDLMGQLGNAAASVGKFMSGDILGGITGMVSSITSVVGIFAKLHDKKYEKRIQNLQKQIDNLQTAYSRLERAFNNTYWVFNDEQRQGYEKNIQAIKDQIAALEKQREVAKKSWDFAQYAKLTAQIKQLNEQLSKAKEGGDMLTLWQSQKESLREQQELMRQQIQAEKSKKKTDNNKIKEWENQIEEINQQIEDLDQQMMETFAGTDVKSAIDEFADAIVDAYCSGEDAAKALGETTKKVLKNAVVEALKRNFLAKGINDAVEYLGKAMEDGVLSDEEKKEFERQANAAGEKFKAGLEAVGDWIKDVDETASDPLTGAVTSMSEETGGVIAGRLNAFIINQGEQTSVMREQLLQQSEIARNTALSAERLQNIENTLRRIETKDNSLLSQGIS